MGFLRDVVGDARPSGNRRARASVDDFLTRRAEKTAGHAKIFLADSPGGGVNQPSSIDTDFME
jgi:hypothetical protein